MASRQRHRRRGSVLTLIIVQRATAALRGQLTRWMLEVQAGVFVGTLSARVREKLWELTKLRIRRGGAVLVYRAKNEQGFVVESHGETTRTIFENEGLLLVKRPLEGE